MKALIKKKKKPTINKMNYEDGHNLLIEFGKYKIPITLDLYVKQFIYLVKKKKIIRKYKCHAQ